MSLLSRNARGIQASGLTVRRQALSILLPLVLIASAACNDSPILGRDENRTKAADRSETVAAPDVAQEPSPTEAQSPSPQGTTTSKPPAESPRPGKETTDTTPRGTPEQQTKPESQKPVAVAKIPEFASAEEREAWAIERLSNRLLTTLGRSESNVVWSPFGLYGALSTLRATSNGKTRAALSAVLLQSDEQPQGKSRLWTEIGAPVLFSPGVLFKVSETPAGLQLASAPAEDSVMWKAGFRKGDVVTHLNDEAVTSTHDFFELTNIYLGQIELQGVTAEGKEFGIRTVALAPSRKLVPAAERPLVKANLLLIRDSLKPADTFNLREQPGPDVHLFPLTTPGIESADKHVRSETAGRLNLKMPVESLGNVDFVITSDVAYVQKWKRPLVDRPDRVGKFELLDGSTVDSHFLFRTSLYRYAKAEGVEVLEIPFADGVTRFRIWLPVTVAEIPQVAALLGDRNKRNVVLSSLARQVVDLEVPEFEIDHELTMQQIVSSLRLMQLSGPAANYSRLAEGAMISELRQTSSLNFNAVGVTAESRTAIVGVPKGSPPRPPVPFTVNRPFFFEIVEQGGVVLYAGRVNTPNTVQKEATPGSEETNSGS